MVPAEVAHRLRSVVGERNCIVEASQLRTYQSDGLTSFHAMPGIVVLPASTEEVVQIVGIAREAGLPIVPRGAGTGLSGGALPVPGCVLVGMSRMRSILEIDLENGWMRVQPGVINLDVSKRIGADGYYYAPDPSSQSVCTIGGNVSENSGGAHCLKYGFTVNHVLGARIVRAREAPPREPQVPGRETVQVGGQGARGPHRIDVEQPRFDDRGGPGRA